MGAIWLVGYMLDDRDQLDLPPSGSFYIGIYNADVYIMPIIKSCKIIYYKGRSGYFDLMSSIYFDLMSIC